MYLLVFSSNFKLYSFEKKCSSFFFLYPTLDAQKIPERLRIGFLQTVYTQPT